MRCAAGIGRLDGRHLLVASTDENPVEIPRMDVRGEGAGPPSQSEDASLVFGNAAVLPALPAAVVFISGRPAHVARASTGRHSHQGDASFYFIQCFIFNISHLIHFFLFWWENSIWGACGHCWMTTNTAEWRNCLWNLLTASGANCSATSTLNECNYYFLPYPKWLLMNFLFNNIFL